MRKKQIMNNSIERYRVYKGKHPGMVLLFENGGIYSVYEDDANTCSEVLGIKTEEVCNSDGTSITKASFPYSLLDFCLQKLIAAGKSICIIEENAKEQKRKI